MGGPLKARNLTSCAASPFFVCSKIPNLQPMVIILYIPMFQMFAQYSVCFLFAFSVQKNQ